MISAEGMVGKHRGELAMINPRFDLVSPAGGRKAAVREGWSTRRPVQRTIRSVARTVVLRRRAESGPGDE